MGCKFHRTRDLIYDAYGEVMLASYPQTISASSKYSSLPNDKQTARAPTTAATPASDTVLDDRHHHETHEPVLRVMSQRVNPSTPYQITIQAPKPISSIILPPASDFTAAGFCGTPAVMTHSGLEMQMAGWNGTVA